LEDLSRSVPLLALLACLAALLGTQAAGAAAGGDCSTPLEAPEVELVYRLGAGEEAVTERVRDETVRILCKRLRGAEIPGEVSALGEMEVRVMLPPMTAVTARRVAEWLGTRGEVYFYDWEANLIGPQRRLGGHPGHQPPRRVWRRAVREWRAAGRDVHRVTTRQAIRAGAFPTLYRAVQLASRQEPREQCSLCSASTPLYYMFDRTARHLPVAGPVTSEGALPAGSAGIVLSVPLGTTIVSERPVSPFGSVAVRAAPGWYAIRDRPALSGSDIVNPKQEFGEFNEPNVTFGFTARGRTAFARVTRAIARRGRASAPRSLRPGRAEAFSGHFAVTLDGEVKTRPIINFAWNPHGISGRTGAQIAGGFSTIQEAQDLATTLGVGALPVAMELVRRGAL
jgi:SecD/SecF fusion protein